MKKVDPALVVDAALLTRLADEGEIDERIAENARRRERNEKRERAAMSLEKLDAERKTLEKEFRVAKISLLSKENTRKINREAEKELGGIEATLKQKLLDIRNQNGAKI